VAVNDAFAPIGLLSSLEGSSGVLIPMTYEPQEVLEHHAPASLDDVAALETAENPIGTPDPERTFKLVLYDGLASEAMGSLTTGVFLAGFAVELGASNFAIGVLASVPFFVQLLQIPAVILVEHVRARRAISVWASGIGRLFLLGAALAPLLTSQAAIIALTTFLAIHQGMGAISGCAWNSWMRDLVPDSEQGRFFGRRAAATTSLSIALAFLGGAVVDVWKNYVPHKAALGYSWLFALSGLIGLYGVFLLSITPEPPMPAVPKHSHPLGIISAPFRDPNFRRLIVSLASWNFSINLAAPFFTVYMLKTLGYPMTTIMVLAIVSQLSNLAALGIWGALIDRFSNKAVLGVCAPLFLACILAWSFTGLPSIQAVVFYALVAIHVLMGISTAGVALASNNLAMKLSPSGEATSYLAANGVVTSVCAAIAPIVGGLGADFFASHRLTLAFTWTGGAQEITVQVMNFHDWTFFFAIASLVALSSLRGLSRVKEATGTSDRLLLRDVLLETRRSIQSLSSAAGLLRVVRIPFSFLRPR
jgi:MFS family permease